LLVLAAPPPALTDFEAARAWAQGADVPPMVAAETLLYAQDPGSALDRLLESPVGRDDPRRLRLELDAFVAKGHTRLGKDRAEELGVHDGWRVHALVQLERLEEMSDKRMWVRIALIMYALCLAALALGGARELLKVSVETLVFAGALLIAVVVVRSASDALAAVLALPGAGALALVHASAATVRRTAPTVRGRLLVGSLLVLGTAGVFFAIGAQIGLTHILALLSA
jgi:hypothetical protein